MTNKRMSSEKSFNKLRVFIDQFDKSFGSLSVVILDMPDSQSILHAWFSSKFGPCFLVRRNKHDISSFCFDNLEKSCDLC